MKPKSTMTEYNVEWKKAQQEKRGGWPQKHGKSWKWHYIEYGTEYSVGGYATKKECESENKWRCE